MTQFMAEKLSAMRTTPTDMNIEQLAASLSCDPSVNTCMYRECENCECNILEIAALYDADDLVKYQWKTAAGKNDYIVTVKETKTQSLQEMLQAFQQTKECFCCDAFNIRHQYRQHVFKYDSLETNECIIRINLAEN